MRRALLQRTVLSSLAGLAAALALSPGVTAAPNGLQKSDEPVMLSANQLGYDRNQALVIALGEVEVVQGETIVLADRITYNQNTGEVFATGNVSVRQPTGDVYFAENVRLQNELQTGVVQNFRARLADNSLFAAREGRRINEDVTELSRAVYSPCKLCDDKENPLWQIKSRDVRIDQKEEEVVYKDAFLEFGGVPVFYTPYFSHATPGAKGKPGILIPDYAADSILGTVIRVPFYYPFAENMDITLSPTITTKEGPMLFGEFRHLTESGYYEFNGSITNPEKRDGSTGARLNGNEIRGHIDAFGNFALTDTWNWGFQLKRATDDTYLRRYDISEEDTLTSRLFAEKVVDREYASVQALAFQGLTREDDPDRSPYIMPLVDYEYESAPGWRGSRWNIAASSLLLERQLGPESRRLSFLGGYTVPLITPTGHVFEASLSLQGDAYNVTEVITPQDPQGYDGTVSRVVPEAALNWRYPLINTYAPNRSILIEPVASAIISPNGINKDEIPNEDSQVLEFSDTNLFSYNRFPGYDRIETGPRLNYGIRGQWQFDANRYLSALVGQNYQTNEDNAFPFTNDVDDHFSDYVGRLSLDWDGWLYAGYRTRIARDKFDPRRNEVNLAMNLDPVAFNFDYLALDSDPFLSDREEVVGNAAYRFTDYWTVFAGTRRDLNENQMLAANVGLRYTDECFGLTTSLNRDFIRDRDVEPSTSLIVRVTLANLN